MKDFDYIELSHSEIFSSPLYQLNPMGKLGSVFGEIPELGRQGQDVWNSVMLDYPVSWKPALAM